MKTLFTFFSLLIGSYWISHGQTCVGIFQINVMDSTSKELIGSELEKDIWYVFTQPEDVFNSRIEEVIPFPQIMENPDGYTIHHNEKQYRYYVTAEREAVGFLPYCGPYLVQMQWVREEDTMSLGVYNIPAHQYFELDSVLFQAGNFFFDLKADKLLHEVTFQEDNGFFLFPSSYIQAFEEEADENTTD